MKPFELAAALRDQTGKGQCRRLRRQGQVPAVLYGSGKAPLSLSLDHEEVRREAARPAGEVVERLLRRHPVP